MSLDQNIAIARINRYTDDPLVKDAAPAGDLFGYHRLRELPHKTPFRRELINVGAEKVSQVHIVDGDVDIAGRRNSRAARIDSDTSHRPVTSVFPPRFAGFTGQFTSFIDIFRCLTVFLTSEGSGSPAPFRLVYKPAWFCAVSCFNCRFRLGIDVTARFIRRTGRIIDSHRIATAVDYSRGAFKPPVAIVESQTARQHARELFDKFIGRIELVGKAFTIKPNVHVAAERIDRETTQHTEGHLHTVRPRRSTSDL